MDINGWIAIITIFTAIFAFLPKEDLHIVLHKTYLIEKVLVLSILLLFIPYLIYFPELSGKFPCLKYFTVTGGLEPSSIAFILFYLIFIWCSIRLAIWKPNKKPTEQTIAYFQGLLNEKPFDEFFAIFTKHTTPKEINTNWNLYWQIFFQQKFLDGIFNNRTKYLLQFWEQFKEEDFKIIFRRYLENPNSDYYNEIKEHWNSSALIEEMPFLNKVLNTNLKQSIDGNVVDILSDYVQEHLTSEHKALRLYNQKHYNTRISEDYGMNLPVFYHIRFYSFLHTNIIRNRISTGGRMLSFYQSITKEMINNVVVPNGRFDYEYPTNYHWLISEMGEAIKTWTENFGEEYFKSNSSYNQFIPYSFWLLLNEVIEGFGKGIVSQKYINMLAYYKMIKLYFSPMVNEEFKGYIENEFIIHIPQEHLEPIFNYALDEAYALHWHNLVSGRFNNGKIMIKRLYEFLKRIEKI